MYENIALSEKEMKQKSVVYKYMYIKMIYILQGHIKNNKKISILSSMKVGTVKRIRGNRAKNLLSIK
jgi:hypothetical protein